jgi:hypothetical protein
MFIGIPEDIVQLPQRVMSTPFGQALKPMFDQMQQSMTSIQGMLDKFNILSIFMKY